MHKLWNQFIYMLHAQREGCSDLYTAYFSFIIQICRLIRLIWSRKNPSQLILRPSQYIRRNHLWFKDQGTYLILSINSSITASMSIERILYYGTSVKSAYALYLRTEGV